MSAFIASEKCLAQFDIYNRIMDLWAWLHESKALLAFRNTVFRIIFCFIIMSKTVKAVIDVCCHSPRTHCNTTLFAFKCNLLFARSSSHRRKAVIRAFIHEFDKRFTSRDSARPSEGSYLWQLICLSIQQLIGFDTTKSKCFPTLPPTFKPAVWHTGLSFFSSRLTARV